MSLPPPGSARTCSPLRGRVRVGRAAGLGGSSLLLAVGAHHIGGGHLPSDVILGVLAGLVGMVAVTVTARRMRFPRLLALLAVEQVLLHWLLTAASTSRTGCSSMLVGHAAHLATRGVVCTSPGVVPAGEQMSMPGWPMLAAHTVATLMTAWLLARGEAWLWRVADRVSRSAAAEPTPWPSATPGGRIAHTGTSRSNASVYRVAEPRAPPVPLSDHRFLCTRGPVFT